MPRYFAIVPAAGSGARFGAELPKQYLPLSGRPLIHHTLAALCRSPRLERVLVVLAPDDAHWRTHDWRDLGPALETVYTGGATRADSVLAGLRALATAAAADDWVLVHDAARPCLSQAMLTSLFDELSDEVGNESAGGLLAVPVADTLKRADADGRVAATAARDGLWQAQTPQMFRYGALLTALEAGRDVTDEAGAMEAAGYKPKLVKGDASNLKVTYPADLALAELILFARRDR
jgi:2-C-methyl-D-erythritol 4-phosphate cytidylyltransferase